MPMLMAAMTMADAAVYAGVVGIVPTTATTTAVACTSTPAMTRRWRGQPHGERGRAEEHRAPGPPLGHEAHDVAAR
ncbi:hypothetical protein [Streptomyces sp. LNU-CPARS28]|uniref:hypothetical protein n=1 Tax=Streptomyces sp. LNU-CPARS28 TaxID=3137371 RepID=UPI0031357BDD